MASPHVAGAAALYLSAHPTAKPQEVRDALVGNAVSNALTPIGSGSPNKLLNIEFIGGTPSDNDYSVSASPDSAAVDPGKSTSSTVKTTVTKGRAQTVKLSASGLPTGATATFSPTSVSAGSDSALTIATSTSTPAGKYTVTINGDGDSADRSATFTLTVNGSSGGNKPPTAAFTATCYGASCQFNGSASSDPDGTISSYAWDFGDGTTGTRAVVPLLLQEGHLHREAHGH